MRQEPYVLDEVRRRIVLRTIQEVAAHRGWNLGAVHVRSTHVHVVITASCRPEKVMIDLKAWCSRRLREACKETADRDRWTQHGSTRYLNDEESFVAAVKYVLDNQGDPMELYDGRELARRTRTRSRVAYASGSFSSRFVGNKLTDSGKVK
jgi:hypothetical protein